MIGDITLSGAVKLDSGASIVIDGPVGGTATSAAFQLSAVQDISLLGRIDGNFDLSANAFGNLTSADSITLSGALSLSGQTLWIEGDVTANSIALVGLIQLSEIQVLAVGGPIAIHGVGGTVDLGAATLVSTSSGDAITVDHASNVILGNVLAIDGRLRLGTFATPIGGLITQTVGSSVSVDRLNVHSAGPLLLPNALNSIRDIESVGVTGDVSIASDRDLVVGLIEVGTSTVTLQANSINDSNADDSPDIVAGELVLTAATGIGNLRALELSGVTNLQGTTESGGIRINWAATADTTISRLEATSGDIQINQTGGHELTIESIRNAEGDVQIVNQLSSLFVAAAAEPSLQVGGGGSVTLSATGPMSDIVVLGRIVTEAGAVSLSAGQSILISGLGNVASTDGSIAIEANQDVGSRDGQITMDDGSRVETVTGTIRLVADGDIRLSSLSTQSTHASAISILSSAGQLIDQGDTDLDLIANHGGVVIDVRSGIGVDNALDTQVGRLIAIVREAGTIQIHEADEIRLDSLETFDGSITVTAGGTVTASQIVSRNQSGLDGASDLGDIADRDIRLTTEGDQSDLLIGQILALNGAHVFLVSSDDILELDEGDDQRIVGNHLAIIAENRTADGDDAVSLSTHVNSLQATVRGSARGDIDIRELTSVTLQSLDRLDVLPSVSTTNGEIRIFVGESLLLPGLEAGDGGVNHGLDPSIVAAGDHGRILLTAQDDLIALDSTRLEASQTTSGSVTLAAQNVILAERFEIVTGNGVGVARAFSPRPEQDLSGTAFYDFNSIRTSVLTQTERNDAEGILTLEIGAAGENGLSIIIDWGAESNRFQQIDNLPGDGTRVNIRHRYTESDILNSTLNGRSSATDPLNVLFAVQHHESIVVIGDSITQGLGATEIVAGRLLSSTDNPMTGTDDTPILENGFASFMIPAIEVPLDLLITREVILEIVEPEFQVMASRTTHLVSVYFGSSETVASSNLIRDEYFQLRSLSPDPDGDDLVPPIRLPADILVGDQLNRLFAELPDGQYEVQYVLGDGGERSILRVDLRQGRPIVPGDDLESGTLRLVPLDPAELDAAKLDAEQLNAEQLDAAEPDAEILDADQFPEPFGASSRLLRPAVSELDLDDATLAIGMASMVAVAPGSVNEYRIPRFSRAGRFAVRYLLHR